MDKWPKKRIFLYIRFGLGVYIVHAKNGIFAIFYALASISKNVIISDISGRTLVALSVSGGKESDSVANSIYEKFAFELPN